MFKENEYQKRKKKKERKKKTKTHTRLQVEKQEIIRYDNNECEETKRIENKVGKRRGKKETLRCSKLTSSNLKVSFWKKNLWDIN